MGSHFRRANALAIRSKAHHEKLVQTVEMIELLCMMLRGYFAECAGLPHSFLERYLHMHECSERSCEHRVPAPTAHAEPEDMQEDDPVDRANLDIPIGAAVAMAEAAAAIEQRGAGILTATTAGSEEARESVGAAVKTSRGRVRKVKPTKVTGKITVKSVKKGVRLAPCPSPEEEAQRKPASVFCGQLGDRVSRKKLVAAIQAFKKQKRIQVVKKPKEVEVNSEDGTPPVEGLHRTPTVVGDLPHDENARDMPILSD